MTLLSVTGVSKEVQGQYTIRNISFDVLAQQRIAITGATGSGKSTLLKMIGGLVQPSAGTIKIEGQKVVGPNDQLIPGHPFIAYLSQHYELRNNYKVHELLDMNNKLTPEAAAEIYEVCRITHLLNRKTDALSGGERQRIVLAGQLTLAPKLLLLDEPFSNLDQQHKNIIRSVIQDIGDRLSITCILVSHDSMDTLSWASRILVMEHGSIVQEGSPKEIYYHPNSEYVAGLFGNYNILGPALIEAVGLNSAKESIFVRPEQFSVGRSNLYALSGTLQQKTFYGSHYMLDVLVRGQIIQVRSLDDGCAIGDVVYLNFRNIEIASC